MTVKLYQLGPHQLDRYDLKPVRNCKWIVHWYEIGEYCGYGEAVSFDGVSYALHSLGHRSYEAPSDKLCSGDVITLDQLFGDSVALGIELRPEMIEKIRELTQ